MAISNQDIIAFLNQMPSEMKKEAIKSIEALRGITVDEYKSQQIEAAKSLLANAQANPDNYTVALIDEKYSKLIGSFKVSKALDRQLGLVKWFISQRSLVTTNASGVEEKQYANQSFEDFMKDKDR